MITSLAAVEIETVTKQKACSRFLCALLCTTVHFEAYFHCHIFIERREKVEIVQYLHEIIQEIFHIISYY